MKDKIEKEIRKAINRHLVNHVQVPNDRRDRIDILVNEAATEILKLVVNPPVIRSMPADDDMWKQEYDAACKEIGNLQEQLKDAENCIRDLEQELGGSRY